MSGPTLPASRFVMACALGLYSTASGRMLKATLADYEAAEQALLVPLVPHPNVDGLLVLDRGFPAIWLFALCQQRHFLAFIDGSLWPGVQAFAVGNLWKHIATRPVGRDTRRAARTLDIEGLPGGIAPFLLIWVRFVNGCEEILATALLDAETYPAADFKACFHWNSLYFLIDIQYGP